MFSSSHADRSVSIEETKKPSYMIFDYCQRKGGLNKFNENLEKFSRR